jgi:hypothetical protein
MEKKNFSALEIEVISFNQADIIRMSEGNGTIIGGDVGTGEGDFDVN